jgi:glycosyltransferase involved in cell wall biosynthesis
LQVTPELETGGAEQTTLDMAAAVVRAGGRALVASHGGRMADSLIELGGELFAMPVQSKNPLTMAVNAARLAMLIRSQKVSLIHARSRAPAFSALLAARMTGVPFIATYHGVYEAKSGLKRWYNSVMTQGAAVIANSDYTRAHILAEHHLDPARVVAIARGVDLTRFDPAMVTPARLELLRESFGVAADDPRIKILLAGRLTRWKGQQLLIDAVARLRGQGRDDFLVLLVGDDQGRLGYRGELIAAIAATGLEKQVRLLGHCNDMPAAYLLADIVVAPSLKPEPFGRTAVEPQMMGRPVLAADHGATRETVADGQTGWLVPPGDVSAWAKALARAMALTPDQRHAIGQAGAERARRLYSVDAMCEATLEVYARVLEARP